MEGRKGKEKMINHEKKDPAKGPKKSIGDLQGKKSQTAGEEKRRRDIPLLRDPRTLGKGESRVFE